MKKTLIVILSLIALLASSCSNEQKAPEEIFYKITLDKGDGKEETFSVKQGSLWNFPALPDGEDGKKAVLAVSDAHGFYLLDEPVKAERDMKLTVKWSSLEWTAENGLITGFTGTDTVAVIPRTVNGEKIRGIADYAFSGKADLAEIVIPDWIEILGNQVFKNCTGIREIFIPSSVTYASSNIFEGWTDEQTVILEEGASLSNWSQYSFNGSYAVVKTLDITLHEGIGYVPCTVGETKGMMLWEPAGTETEITVPSAVEGLPVIAIGYGAFDGNSKILRVTLPEGIRFIAPLAFRNSSVTDIGLPSSLLKIGSGAFTNAQGIREMKIPAGTSYLGSRVFYNWGNDQKITIARTGNVISWPNDWNEGCEAEVVYEGILDLDGVIYAEYTEDDGTEAYFVKGHDGTKDRITVKKDIEGVPVRLIGFRAFAESEILKEVTLPEGIRTIENGAFWNSKNITRITVPASVGWIGTRAFDGWTSSQTIIISASLQEAGWSEYWQTGCWADVKFGDEMKDEATGLRYVKEKVDGEVVLKVLGMDGDLKDVTIPAVYRDIPVYEIDKSAFQGSLIEKLTIENGVRKLGVFAFTQSAQLREIVIPESITEIPYQCFYRCTLLSKASLPSTLTKLGGQSFSGTAFTEFIMPDSVTVYEQYAVQSMQNLKKVKFGANITELPSDAMNGLPVLEEIVLPAKLEKLDDLALRSLGSVKKMVLPDTLVEIGKQAFNGMKGIARLEIPASVTKVGYGAFAYWTSDQTIAIPTRKQTESWDEDWRWYCKAEIVYLEDKVIDGATYFLTEDENGNKVAWLQKGPGADVTEFVIPSRVENDWTVVKIAPEAMKNNKTLTSITISSSVSEIGADAMNGCTALESVTFQEGCALTEIADRTFSGAAKLKTISIPDTVTRIGDEAFKDCSALTELALPSGLTAIGTSAFEESRLASVTMPDTVTELGNRAFAQCTNLREIRFSHRLTALPDAVAFYANNLTTVSFPVDLVSIGGNAFAWTALGREGRDLTIPSSVTTIGSGAFSRSGSYGTLTIPAGVLSMGENVFSNSQTKKLVISDASKMSLWDPMWRSEFTAGTTEYIKGAEVYDGICYVKSVPESGDACWHIAGTTGKFPAEIVLKDRIENIPVTHIDTLALSGISGVSKITIPSTVTTIAEKAFFASGITEVSVPASVTTVGEYVFEQCGSLVTAEWNTSAAIPNYAFWRCKALKNVTIAEGVEIIRRGAFQESGIASLQLPAGLVEIEGYFVKECCDLKKIRIPKSVVKAGSYLFYMQATDFKVEIETASQTEGWDEFWKSDLDPAQIVILDKNN